MPDGFDDRAGDGAGWRRRLLWGLMIALAACLARAATSDGRAGEARRLAAREAVLDRRLLDLFAAHERHLRSPDQPPPPADEVWRVYGALRAVRDRLGELDVDWPWPAPRCCAARADASPDRSNPSPDP